MMRARIGHLVEGAVLISVPLVLALCAYFSIRQAALITLFTVCSALVLFIVGWERSAPALRQIMPVVVLAALAAVGRLIFIALPSVQPVTAICIIAGAAFGKRSGFLVGALAALVSNIFAGQGPWTPWQMYAWGLVGYLAGTLARHRIWEHAPARLVLGFCAALLYGLFLNSWTLLGFFQPLTWQAVLFVFGGSLPFDITHGVATVLFLAILYEPWRKKLNRIVVKFSLAE